ncbi:phospholipase D-like domain-containing protein [Spiroplasma endosymbiont of Clivina fossor]|uniref:phospholipase D-like domain-containing protein n=1 Tax=Spiroplasma endosymbiont of Clivina fossor TaxID=3066282 RepID=UPI00313E5C94
MLNKKMRLAITFVLLVLLLVTCIFIIAKYIDWLWIIGVVTISFGTLTALIIFVSNRPARTKISWIIAVYALPIVGIIIFIIFGRTYRYTKAQKFYLKKYQDFYAKEDFNYTNNFLKNQIKEERSILHLTTNISQRPLYNHTKVDLITNGIEKFSLLFKDLESAENYIHINYFILDDGEVLKYLTQLLIKKTYQGVNIRLIYDHAGSFFTVYHDTIQKLKRAGVHLKRFSPINLPFISGRNNYRNHRKDVIIDGKIGYTGGINVGDAYCHLSSKYGFWRDSQVRLQGSAVCSLELIFLQDWYFTTGESLVVW